MTKTSPLRRSRSGASPTIRINVGPLNGLGSFCVHCAQQLRHFSDLYNDGCTPELEWDLTNLVSRRMSVAAIAAFLSTALRLRRYVSIPPIAHLRWDPEVLGFLDDISFFRIVRTHDLFQLPESVIGGFASGKTNPHTEILDFTDIDPPPDTNQADLIEYKDYWRQRVKEHLLLRCGHIFKSRSSTIPFPSELQDHVAIAAAELVLNSLLWGRAPAFLALGRSSKRVTVAACDSGFGFVRSLNERNEFREGPFTDHSDALMLASILNRREFGLYRTIDLVINQGGWISMASFDSEIHWATELWSKARAQMAPYKDRFIQLKALRDIREEATPSGRSRARGFIRRFQYGLRGSRISFEIPIITTTSPSYGQLFHG